MDTNLTSKQLVRGAFESTELPRLPFLPWVFRHAARLEQTPLSRMYADPTRYVKCLQNARKLYSYDAIISGFDPSLDAETAGRPVKWQGDYETPAAIAPAEFDMARLADINVLGASRTGRFGTVIESLRRIQAVSGSNVALAAVVSGPLALAANLTGHDLAGDFEASKPAIEAAAVFILKIVQVYCQLEMDIIAFVENAAARLTAGQLGWLQPVVSPIVNTVKFYNAWSVMLPGDASPENLGGLIDLGFNGIVAAGIDVVTWNEIRNGRACMLGKAIPAGILAGPHAGLQQYLKSELPGCAGTGVFLTTDREVPPDTPPENIRLVVDMISR
jgi:uroporphyrinogen-III decarboxylase